MNTLRQIAPPERPPVLLNGLDFPTPHWVAAMQIGDGFIVVRPQNSQYQLLFPPDKGEYINETTFITSANALDEMLLDVLTGNQEFICASQMDLRR